MRRPAWHADWKFYSWDISFLDVAFVIIGAGLGVIAALARSGVL